MIITKKKKAIKNKMVIKRAIAHGMQRTVSRGLNSHSMNQVCLNVRTVFEALELLKEVPDFHIESMTYRSEASGLSTHLIIPKKLMETGIKTILEEKSRLRIGGILTGNNLGRIKKHIETIAKHYKTEVNSFLVKRLLISRGSGRLLFISTLKEIRLPEDKRRKVSVLGLEAISRAPEYKEIANDLLIDLQPKSYSCKFTKVTKNVVLCSEIQ